MQLISFIKVSLLTGGILFFSCLSAQELYVFSEPASNMPSHSVSAKLSGKFVKGMNAGQFRQRYSPEVMLGLNKSWMLHGAATFSDMYTSNLRWESARVYAKYRFLSLDEVHRHFRMAAFAELAHSVNDVHFDELSLEGDQSGMQGGVILTQLWNKLAVSSTLSYINVTSKEAKSFSGDYPNQAFNYSLSAGYLVLPVSYTSFKQTNLNIYAELLGQRALDMRRYSVDLAPAVQLIFNSNAKLNAGYRFQLNGNMNRMGERGWLVSFERTFLNALKK
jgi:hypothetical protein